MDSAELNAKSEPKTIQRIEVLTGPERRRQWSAEDKERIVTESFSGVDKVSRIARRHGLSPQQLFTWRREARQRSAEAGPSFIPAIVELASAHRGVRQQAAPVAAIELDMGGARVRIGAGAKASIVSAVIRALKETS